MVCRVRITSLTLLSKIKQKSQKACSIIVVAMVLTLACLMYGALHPCVGDHAEQAGPEAPVEGGQRLVAVDRACTLHHAVVGAAVLQVQPHL